MSAAYRLSTCTRQLRGCSRFSSSILGRTRLGHYSPLMSSLRFGSTSTFEQAVDKVSSVKKLHRKLFRKDFKLYGLYKQATVGVNQTKEPEMTDIVGKAKWEAWNGLGNMSQDEAKKKYVELVDSLSGSQSCINDDEAKKRYAELADSLSGSQSGKAEAKVSERAGIQVTVKDGIRTILVNRPEKFNALTREMYSEITKSLTEANTDDTTNIVVLAGNGNYFCTGNDISKSGREQLLNYVSAYIECRKPLIALAHGPAAGIPITVLGLCDAVYCTDKATFSSPFSALGRPPVACSSYTFPRIMMGYAKASELLFFNTKTTAAEAEQVGLVSQVFPDETFLKEAWDKVNQIAKAKFPAKSMIYSKELVRERDRQVLHAVNKAECDILLQRRLLEACIYAIMFFFSFYVSLLVLLFLPFPVFLFYFLLLLFLF